MVGKSRFEKSLKEMKVEHLCLDFSRAGGVLPVVVQNIETQDVIAVYYAEKEEVDEIIKNRNLSVFYCECVHNKVHWFVRRILVNCMQDALLVLVSYETIRHNESMPSPRGCFCRELFDLGGNLFFVKE